MDLDEVIFDKPSGNVRGFVNAFIVLKGKKKRVAHAFLLTEGGSEISLDVPKKMGVSDALALAEVLSKFATRVFELASL